MKVLPMLALVVVSMAAVVELVGGGGGDGAIAAREGGARRPHKRTSRPRQFKGASTEMHAARRPANAPSKYRTDVGHPTRKRLRRA